MGDLAALRTTRQMRASGFAGLFGLFAGLCAIFAGCVTLSDWYTEITQARWPVTTAVIDRADVSASRRAPKYGSALEWRLYVHMTFGADGGSRSTRLTSRAVYSEEEAATLQSWAAQHRKGSHIDIRYDPSQPNRAVFAAAEPGFTQGGIRDDLILFAIAAIAAAGLLALARYLRAREAAAAPVPDDPQRGMLVFGSLFAATGLMIMGIALYGATHADPFTADRLMAVPAGLMFFFAGILIGLPPQHARWRSLLATLVITCFAVTFDWVAFGPGERRFTGSINGIGFIPGEMMGRIFFGMFAIVLDICAVAMWVGQCRQIFWPNPSAPGPADFKA